MRQLRSACLAMIAAALSCAAQAGWKDLTPAKGWKRFPIPTTATLSPENQWRYDPKLKILICTCDKGREILRSDREYTDFDFHVEWRFQRLDGEPRYNGGVFVRTSPDGDFMTQAQVGPGPATWLFADYPVDGKKTRVNLRDKMTGSQKVNPPGEWNTYDLRVEGSKVTLSANGEVVGSMDNVPVAKGYVGLEAEGFYIEFKNVRIRELKK